MKRKRNLSRDIQFRKNMVWNALGDITYLGAQWLITIIVIRVAGYEDARLLSLATSISETFQTIVMFGVRNFQVSDLKPQYSDAEYVSLRIVTCVTIHSHCSASFMYNSKIGNFKKGG